MNIKKLKKIGTILVFVTFIAGCGNPGGDPNSTNTNEGKVSLEKMNFEELVNERQNLSSKFSWGEINEKNYSKRVEEIDKLLTKKGGIKITITGLYGGRVYLTLYDKNNLEACAKAEGEVTDKSAVLYLQTFNDSNVPWTTTGDYYVSYYNESQRYFTDGQSFQTLGLTQTHEYEEYEGEESNKRLVRKYYRTYVLYGNHEEFLSKLPAFNLKADGNIIDAKKFDSIPEYGGD